MGIIIVNNTINMGATESISFNNYGQPVSQLANPVTSTKYDKCMSRCTSTSNTKMNGQNLRRRLSNSYKVVKTNSRCAAKCSTTKNNMKIKQYYTSTVGSTITANHAINKSDNSSFNEYSGTEENLTLNKYDFKSSGGSSSGGSGDNSTDGTKKPVKVVVTGGCGNIAYSMAFRIASGQLLGPKQPVHLTLLDIPVMVPRMKGLEMELTDCAFKTLSKIT